MTKDYPPAGAMMAIVILAVAVTALPGCSSDHPNGASGSSTSSSSGGSSSGSSSSSSSSSSSGSSSSGSGSGSSSGGAAAIAYIVNAGSDTVSICGVHQPDGSLNSCSVSSGNGTFNGPLAITVNPTATIAYVANFGSNDISACAIESNGLFGSCIVLSDATFAQLTGVTLNPSGDTLYASNFGTGNADGSVSVCPLRIDGSLAVCASSGTMAGLFAYPEMIGINPADGTHLYSSGVANQLSMTLCNIVGSNGSLTACTTASGSGAAPNPGFLAPQGISFNVPGTIAYIGNGGNSGPISNFVSVCPVNPDGSFGSCTITEGNGTFNFSANTEIGLFISSMAIAYVPNSGNNTVSICPINQDGSLGVCAVSDGGGTLNVPSAVFLALEP